MVIFQLFLSFGTLIKGQNSLDQIIYTWLIALLICFFSYIVIRPYTIYHVRKMTEMNQEFTQEIKQGGYACKVFWVFFYWVMSIAIFNLISTYVQNNYSVPEELQDILVANCPG